MDFRLLKNLNTLKTSSHVLKNTLSRYNKTCFYLKYSEILWMKDQNNLQTTDEINL